MPAETVLAFFVSQQNMQPRIYRVGTLTYTRPKLAILLFWLLWGDFCYMLMENVVPSILPLKFKELGASNMTVGLILSTIPLGMMMIFNPIISFRSDRFRSRWGRRIPFIAVTLPVLVLFLTALAFGDRIGWWLHDRLGSHVQALSPNTMALLTIGAIMVVFSFFNTFVNSVFWYLFNDVVPEHLLSRFMSWFRTVSVVSISLYNLFIFKYAGTHSTEILVGAALLYLVGFGLMCLNVKEGEYPPPPAYVDGQSGIAAAVKTYGKECFSMRFYWYVFMLGIGWGGVGAAVTFQLYLFQSTGLDLDKIGNINGAGNIVMGVTILISGWLADRYHPIRVVIGGLLMHLLLASPASMIFLFWQPSPKVAYYLWMAINVGMISPAMALIAVQDVPLFARIFPRDRYGQFCSANALLRSLSMMLGGLLVGIFLDVLTKRWGARVAYCCLPLWQACFLLLMLVVGWMVYRSWKKYGGDTSYVPPLPDGAVRTEVSSTRPDALHGAAVANH